MQLGAALLSALVASPASAAPAAREAASGGDPIATLDSARAVATPAAVRLAAVDPGAQRNAAPEIQYKDTPPPPGSWRHPTGKWLTIAGVALLAGGVTMAVMNKQLANDLEQKYSANELTPADASKYDQVDTYNTWSTVLLATGAAATGVGLYFWGTAPDEPGHGRSASFGLHGRF